MTIDKLQKALVILNKNGDDGNIYGEHDQIYFWPNADSFTADEVEQLESLGFIMNDEGGFECFHDLPILLADVGGTK